METNKEMTLNDYQRKAMTTCMDTCDNAEKKKITAKGSYFPGEEYDFESAPDKLELFVEMLKSRGCYIAEDGHIRSRKGGMMSKLMRNGYYLTMAQYNKKCYYFCEHRVVWVWNNGAIPKDKEINHKDYNRANNKIENLEIVSHSENMQHSRPNFNPCRGEKSGKSKLTDKQAQAIKTLGNVCGWNVKQITSLLDGLMTGANIGRVINGKRYPNIIEAESVLSIYPVVVDFTRNKSIGIEEELKNYALGLSGEVGEFNDLIKKMLYHGKEVQPVDLMLELGDILYYLVAICNVLGFDFSDIAVNNNTKLMARYPDGYSIQNSNDRIEERAFDNAVMTTQYKCQDLANVCQDNLAKLASRQTRGVISGNGDNR